MIRSFAAGLIFAVLAMVLGLYSCAHAQERDHDAGYWACLDDKCTRVVTESEKYIHAFSLDDVLRMGLGGFLAGTAFGCFFWFILGLRKKK